MTVTHIIKHCSNLTEVNFGSTGLTDTGITVIVNRINPGIVKLGLGSIRDVCDRHVKGVSYLETFIMDYFELPGRSCENLNFPSHSC